MSTPGSWGPSLLDINAATLAKALKLKPPTPPNPVYLTIYGYSDDLVEVEGELKAEFNATMHVPYRIVIGDSTTYPDNPDNPDNPASSATGTRPTEIEIEFHVGHLIGQWKIKIIHLAYGCQVQSHAVATDADTQYSDRLVLLWPQAQRNITKSPLDIFFGTRIPTP